MSSQSRRIKRASPDTIQAKVLVGYHAWFTCAGDGAPVHPGHHGWTHWFDRPLSQGGRPTFDLFPDVTSYTPSELYPVQEMPLVDGSPARLFSSRNPATIKRHFHWLAEHGIDGVFLQRFAAHCEVDGYHSSPLGDLTRHRDAITDKVREAAEAEGRVWAIEYDVRGVPMERLPQVILRDWDRLIREKGILTSPNYLRERGRAVIGIRGIGFRDGGHDPLNLISMMKQLRSITPGGLYIMAGVSTHWRVANVGDHDANPAFRELYREVDALSPWSIGQFDEEQSADWFATEVVRKDVQEIRSWNEAWDGQKKVDYIPVAFPGYSAANLRPNLTKNEIPRQGGRFLWRQIFHLQREGARILYIESLDGYDDATAILPITALSRLLPTDWRFLALDADGDTNLPPDWYMRICGMAAEVFRGDKRIATDLMPKKELDDYWAMRPHYEEEGGAGSSIEGSNMYSAAGSSAIGSASGSRQPTSSFGQPSAPQRSATLDIDCAPAPPPYSLEAEQQTTTEPSPSVPPIAERRSTWQLEPSPAATLTTSPAAQTEPLPPQSEGQGLYNNAAQPPEPGATRPTSLYSSQMNPVAEQHPPRNDTRPHPSHSDSMQSYYSTAPPTACPASRPASRPPTSNSQRPGSAGVVPPSNPVNQTPSNAYIPQNISPGPTEPQVPNPIPGFSNLSMQSPPHPMSPPPGGPVPSNNYHPPAGFFSPQDQGYHRPFSPPSMNAGEGSAPGNSMSSGPQAVGASSFPNPGFQSYWPPDLKPLPDPSAQASNVGTPSQHPTNPNAQATQPQHPITGSYQPHHPQGSSASNPQPPVEGGFVMPGQTPPAAQQRFQPGVGGFSPSLGRATSAKVTGSVSPPPLHPSRAGTVPPTPTTALNAQIPPSGLPPVPSLPGQQPSTYSSQPHGNYSHFGASTSPPSVQNTPTPMHSGSYGQQSYPSPPAPGFGNQAQHTGDSQQQPSSQYTPYQPPPIPPPTTQYPLGYQSYPPSNPTYQATTYGAPAGHPPPHTTHQPSTGHPPSGQTYTPTPPAGPSYSYGGSHIPSGGYGLPAPGGYQQQQPWDQQQQPWGQHGTVAQATPHQPKPTTNQTAPLGGSMLDPARNALDRYAGEERRKMLEKGLGNAMNTGSKWLNKFSGSK